MGFSGDIDVAAVISDNFGVDLTWSPYKHSEWVVDFITQVTQLGLGFIPVAGPLVSVGFSLGLTAIVNPETFKTDNVLRLTTDVMAAVLASAVAMKGNLPPGFTALSA